MEARALQDICEYLSCVFEVSLPHLYTLCLHLDQDVCSLLFSHSYSSQQDVFYLGLAQKPSLEKETEAQRAQVSHFL